MNVLKTPKTTLDDIKIGHMSGAAHIETDGGLHIKKMHIDYIRGSLTIGGSRPKRSGFGADIVSGVAATAVARVIGLG